VKRLVKAYHGTNSRFSQFEQNKARIANDYYGGGIAYFTDTLDIAKTYAGFMFRKFGGERYVYEVELQFDKLFDVDSIYTGDELKRLIGNQLDAFARGAGLLKLGGDRVAVLSALKDGKLELTGEQVFRGLSNGMQNTAWARSVLKKCGYDGLRHNGGVNMGGPKHNVYLAYDSRSVNIKNRFIVTKTKVPLTAKQETYVFIN
jgi:hypothetical protein